MGWIWVLIPLAALSIPIVAILASMIEKLMKSQERQVSLMNEEVISEIQMQLTASEEERKLLKERIVNLETLVSTYGDERNQQRALPVSDQSYVMPDVNQRQDMSHEEKVASLARKLRE